MLRWMLSGLVLAQAWALEVQTVDGRLLRGADAAIEGDELVFGDQRVPLRRCDWIAPAAGAPAQQAELGLAPVGVRLRNGGYLPALDVTASTSSDRLLVTSPLGSFDLPLAAVSAWGERPTVLSAASATDHDQLQLQNGQSLSGELRGVSAEGVVIATDLADEPLVIPLEQVRLARLRSAAQTIDGLYLRLVHDPALPPLFLAAEQPWRLHGLPETRVVASLPLPRLTVMGGDKVRLSSLEPVEVVEEGAFDVVWHWSRDRQIDGDPIQLRGRIYDTGIVVHSRAQLTYDLDGAYEGMRAVAGIIDAMGYEGDCVLRLLVDGEERFSQRLRGAADPLPVSLDLAGAQRLGIVVDIGERYDIGDHVALGDAFLVRVGD